MQVSSEMAGSTRRLMGQDTAVLVVQIMAALPLSTSSAGRRILSPPVAQRSALDDRSS